MHRYSPAGIQFDKNGKPLIVKLNMICGAYFFHDNNRDGTEPDIYPTAAYTSLGHNHCHIRDGHPIGFLTSIPIPEDDIVIVMFSDGVSDIILLRDPWFVEQICNRTEQVSDIAQKVHELWGLKSKCVRIDKGISARLLGYVLERGQPADDIFFGRMFLKGQKKEVQCGQDGITCGRCPHCCGCGSDTTSTSSSTKSTESTDGPPPLTRSISTMSPTFNRKRSASDPLSTRFMSTDKRVQRIKIEARNQDLAARGKKTAVFKK